MSYTIGKISGFFKDQGTLSSSSTPSISETKYKDSLLPEVSKPALSKEALSVLAGNLKFYMDNPPEEHLLGTVLTLAYHLTPPQFPDEYFLTKKESQGVSHFDGKGTNSKYSEGGLQIRFDLETGAEIVDLKDLPYWSFLAACLVRFAYKTKEQMESFLKERFSALFSALYSKAAKEVEFSSRFIGACEFSIKKTFLPVSHLTGTIVKFSLTHQKPEDQSKYLPILNGALLTHTRYHGLSIVALLFKAAQVLGDDTGEIVFQALSASDLEKETLALFDFMTTQLNGSETRGAPWARAVSDCYYTSMSMVNFPKVAVRLAAIAETSSYLDKKGIWGMKALEGIPVLRKQKEAELGAMIREYVISTPGEESEFLQKCRGGKVQVQEEETVMEEDPNVESY